VVYRVLHNGHAKANCCGFGFGDNGHWLLD
jgi:hypothetical protein